MSVRALGADRRGGTGAGGDAPGDSGTPYCSCASAFAAGRACQGRELRFFAAMEEMKPLRRVRQGAMDGRPCIYQYIDMY